MPIDKADLESGHLPSYDLAEGACRIILVLVGIRLLRKRINDDGSHVCIVSPGWAPPNRSVSLSNTYVNVRKLY
jgi:hypothetical protein